VATEIVRWGEVHPDYKDELLDLLMQKLGLAIEETYGHGGRSYEIIQAPEKEP
jgi:hypothetical protein